jgi:hypothetical protein
MQAPAHSRSTQRAQRLLVLLFLAFLGAPWIDMLARPASARGPEVEGRHAHPFPPWKPPLLWQTNLPKHFELAFSDSLGLRDFLLRWHNRLMLDLLHVAPSPTVLLGQDGWLFYTGESSVEIWRGLNRMQDSQLAAWQQVLESRRDRARALGADYFFVLGPNKESIYPDYLPERFEPLGPTRFDQLAAWMQAHSDVTLIDLRPCLRAARAEDTPQHHLYYEEGTHWHGRGCMVAAREILRRVALRFPAMAQVPETHWRMDSYPAPESWRTKMYLAAPATRLRDEWRQTDETRRARPLTADATAPIKRFEQLVRTPGLPSAILFHDSFGPGLLKLLAERFSTFTAETTNDFDDALVAVQRPAIVIDLYVERLLVIPDPRAFFSRPGPALVPAGAGEAARFDASSEVRLRCDAQTPASAFQTSSRLSLEARLAPPAPGLLLHSSGESGTLTLPEIAAGPERDLVLRLELASPVDSQADVFYASAADEPWSDRRSLPLLLQRGNNRLDVLFAASEHVRRLRLRPGRTAGTTYVLLSAEVRAVAPR